ncbi:MAG: KTSC domain-containing protein [Allosphingosinicella sp.]
MLATRLSSSVIERILYDEEAKALFICFRETGRYLYSGVPRAIYEGLKKAPSPGRYFNEFIKRRFPCRPDPERRRFRPVAGEGRDRSGEPGRGPSGLSRRACGG